MRFARRIAIGGTHGKTTTTSLVATLLDAGGLDPTVVNGGIINAYGTNARMGAGEWMVVEADESDGTFLKLPADIAVVTNIDPEHLDHYGTFDARARGVPQFVENVPFYGFGVMCTRPSGGAGAGRRASRIAASSPMAATRRPTCASTSTSHGRCASLFDVVIRDRMTGSETTIDDLGLPMPGEHNVSNATAAIAVAHELGIKPTTSARACRASAASSAASRRPAPGTACRSSTITATTRSRSRRCCRAAREPAKGRVIAVVQPHRYTRLHDLFDEFAACFNDADTVIVAPVYAAGEEPIEGVNSEALVVAGPRRRPPRRAQYRGAAGDRAGWCASSPSRATSSSSSAPATSRNGPTRCPGNWAGRRHEP